MAAARIVAFTLLLATCGTANEDYSYQFSTSKMRACFYPNGPHDDEKCKYFQDRWLNKTASDKSGDSEFGNMTKKDLVVSLGCFALFTFNEHMAEMCVDANLLTDLLLCQYDFVDDKYLLLQELDNVKTRDDIVKMMEDFKNCVGTTPDELPEGYSELEMMKIFVRPLTSFSKQHGQPERSPTFSGADGHGVTCFNRILAAHHMRERPGHSATLSQEGQQSVRYCFEKAYGHSTWNCLNENSFTLLVSCWYDEIPEMREAFHSAGINTRQDALQIAREYRDCLAERPRH
ncbi:hypothetical protein MTO96_018470 [Rhipicephalus appendiculatus]